MPLHTYNYLEDSDDIENSENIEDIERVTLRRKRASKLLKDKEKREYRSPKREERWS